MTSSARRSSIEVLKEIRQALTVYGNQKVAAKAWHVSAPYLSDAELGRVRIPSAIS
jgi:DNA-binding transcriptional regulator YdaS (Cro superfamily)